MNTYRRPPTAREREMHDLVASVTAQLETTVHAAAVSVADRYGVTQSRVEQAYYKVERSLAPTDEPAKPGAVAPRGRWMLGELEVAASALRAAIRSAEEALTAITIHEQRYREAIRFLDEAAGQRQAASRTSGARTAPR